MEYLQSIIDNTNAPFLYAFLLGLMTAISPCPLATNITATAFISKDVEDKKKIFKNGLFYTLGRTISYSALGVILFFGASKFQVARFFQGNGEKMLGPLLIIIGILMLNVIPIKWPSFDLGSKFSIKKVQSSWGALLLGMIFALAFCPYSGVLFFGMLIPMTIASTEGLFYPVVFAFATGLPVIVVAYLIAFSVSQIGNFYSRVQSFEKVFRKVVAFVFIGVGIYYISIFYI